MAGTLAQAKRLLRKQVLAARDRMDPEQRERASRDVCQRLADWGRLRRAQTLALYRAFGTELTLAPLVEALEALPSEQRPILLAPAVLGPQRMEFFRVSPRELLDPGATPAFLLSPDRVGTPSLVQGRTPVDARDIELALVPAVALGTDCTRLGHGGGFYDAFLGISGFAGFSCAVVFDEQIRPAGQVPSGPGDVRVDMVLTPSATYGDVDGMAALPESSAS